LIRAECAPLFETVIRKRPKISLPSTREVEAGVQAIVETLELQNLERSDFRSGGSRLA